MDFSGNLHFRGSTVAALPQVERRRRRPLRDEEIGCVYEASEGSRFFAWLFAQVDLDAACYRTMPLLRRIPACLRLLRARTIDEAQRRLEQVPGLIPATISTALLGVTRFHRDEVVFDWLRTQGLPRLLAQSAQIRVWSAACSDGQELYSIAMLLEEEGRLTRAELLGTDCRPDAIRRAAAGSYPAEPLHPLGPRRLAHHFVSAGTGHVQVDGRLRAATRWRVADLFGGAMPGPWDLVLWRNMVIYLTPAAAERAWRMIAAEVRPGGYLVVGKADHPPQRFGWQRVAPSVYQKPEEWRDA